MRAPYRAFVAAVIGAAVALGASPAFAQERTTQDRTTQPHTTEPSPATQLAPPAPGEATERDRSTADLGVPPVPGAGYDDEVRYPVPTPERAGRPADEEPAVRISSRVTTRLRALDANLRSLAARGGSNVVNAVLSLLTGGLAVTLGALTEPNDDWMSIYLYVYGGTAAARGVLELVLTPNASGPAVTYQHMPMTSEAEVQARLAYGENALRSLAERALIARVLDASLNLAAGVAVVPLYLAPKEFELHDPLDYFILIGAGVSVISGIISLVSTSAAEQRWDAYQELRDRLARERDAEREHEVAEEDVALLPTPREPTPRLRIGGGPTPGGAFAGVTVQF